MRIAVEAKASYLQFLTANGVLFLARIWSWSRRETRGERGHDGQRTAGARLQSFPHPRLSQARRSTRRFGSWKSPNGRCPSSTASRVLQKKHGAVKITVMVHMSRARGVPGQCRADAEETASLQVESNSLPLVCKDSAAAGSTAKARPERYVAVARD